jgi:hypothetical protein
MYRARLGSRFCVPFLRQGRGAFRFPGVLTGLGGVNIYPPPDGGAVSSAFREPIKIPETGRTIRRPSGGRESRSIDRDGKPSVL